VGVLLDGGFTHVFIVRWDARAPQDQTDVTKGRDALGKAVEEHSRRGRQTLVAGRHLALWWGRPAPPGNVLAPHCFGCLLDGS